MKEEAAKRIIELTKIIDDANYEYYVLANPTLTDQEFDKYLKELENLEKEYPELRLQPTEWEEKSLTNSKK